MGLLKAANSTAIPWNTVQQPDLSDGSSGSITPGANTAGYQPTMALAQNHIHFMGVPGLTAGSVKIFVIHCMFPSPLRFLFFFFLFINTLFFFRIIIVSYMQPAPQSMGSFPTSHGKTASFFQSTGVQQEFAFIPDDGSSTFVVNVEVSFSLCVSSLVLYS